MVVSHHGLNLFMTSYESIKRYIIKLKLLDAALLKDLPPVSVGSSVGNRALSFFLIRAERKPAGMFALNRAR